MHTKRPQSGDRGLTNLTDYPIDCLITLLLLLNPLHSSHRSNNPNTRQEFFQFLDHLQI